MTLNQAMSSWSLSQLSACAPFTHINWLMHLIWLLWICPPLASFIFVALVSTHFLVRAHAVHHFASVVSPFVKGLVSSKCSLLHLTNSILLPLPCSLIQIRRMPFMERLLGMDIHTIPTLAQLRLLHDMLSIFAYITHHQKLHSTPSMSLVTSNMFVQFNHGILATAALHLAATLVFFMKLDLPV